LVAAVERLKNGLVAHATGGRMDDAEYQRLRSLVMGSAVLKGRVPAFIRDCRMPHEFWGFIQPKFPSYQERREFLAGEFNPILSDLESRRLSSVARVRVEAAVSTSDPASHEFIHEQLEKCDAKLGAGDFDGAITNARSLVEAVLREMERRLSVEPPHTDGDLAKQYKRVAKLMNLDPNKKGLDAAFVEILRGLVSIVNGLATLRNTASDAHARTYRPEQHHARLAVNTAKTVVDFLFETYEYQKRTGKLVADQQA